MSKITNPSAPGAPTQVDSAGSITRPFGGSFPALDATFDPARTVTRMTEIVAQIQRPAGADRPGHEVPPDRRG